MSEWILVKNYLLKINQNLLSSRLNIFLNNNWTKLILVENQSVEFGQKLIKYDFGQKMDKNKI